MRWHSETNAINSDDNGMHNFNNLITRNCLIESLLSNNKYTWSNLRIVATLSRLDRFLYIGNWEQNNNFHYPRVISRYISDHFPIVLESEQIEWCPCPFLLNNSSLKERDFKTNIQVWWENTRQPGKHGYHFLQRLKTLAS